MLSPLFLWVAVRAAHGAGAACGKKEPKPPAGIRAEAAKIGRLCNPVYNITTGTGSFFSPVDLSGLIYSKEPGTQFGRENTGTRYSLEKVPVPIQFVSRTVPYILYCQVYKFLHRI